MKMDVKMVKKTQNAPNDYASLTGTQQIILNQFKFALIVQTGVSTAFGDMFCHILEVLYSIIPFFRALIFFNLFNKFKIIIKQLFNVFSIISHSKWLQRKQAVCELRSHRLLF